MARLTIRFAGPFVAMLALIVGTPDRADAAPAEPPAFDILYRVLTSPRCLNCHVAGNFPRQGDERRRHDFGVLRGEAGHGVAAMRCAACHTDRNHGNFPGAPHWGLAPIRQRWEGLDAAALCRALKDPRSNGKRDVAELVIHMRDDPLVRWGWEPGGTRKPVPVTREEFVRALEAWAATGAPCPAP
jgi:hypothetical protein